MDLHIDLETVATVDLRRTGVYRYAEDVNTDVIVAWLYCPQTGRWEEWRPNGYAPPLVQDAVALGWTIHAWNAQFERALWRAVLTPRYGWPEPTDEQFSCTMATAAYWGWPASLDMAGQAMGLSSQKDKEGHALMLRMCRPRSYAEDGTPVWWHNEDRAKYDKLSEYCRGDVAAEVEAAKLLPELPPTERKLWLLDQRMNAKGMPVDMTLADAMQAVATEAEQNIRAEMKELTCGAVTGPNAHAALSRWLASAGIDLPDLTADTIKQALKTPLAVTTGQVPPPDVRRVLELRQAGAKASTAKLKAFREAVCSDGTVKGGLRYYGAARTGRWSGAGGNKTQPHNIPRGSLKKPEVAIDLMLEGHGAAVLEMLYEESALGVIASCLRGVFACE